MIIRKGSLLLIAVTMLLAVFSVTSTVHAAISKVMITDETDRSVRVSWVQSPPVPPGGDGIVRYGTAPGVFDTEVTGKDEGGAIVGIHYVDITLPTAPLTTYYVELESGGEIDNNGGPGYEFTTAQSVAAGPNYFISGKVFTKEGSLAEGSIKYIQIERISDGRKSNVLANLVGSNGFFFVNLANLVDPTDGSRFIPITGDKILARAEGAEEGIDDRHLDGSITITGSSPQSIDDEALPVEFSIITASPVGEGVSIQWRTETEINNLGFDVYRSESPDGPFVKVNPAHIKGAGTDGTSHNYQFVDESTVVGKTYYYYIEAISFSGEREKSHIIKVIVDVSGKVKVTGLMQPTTFALLQNFPNPFNPETWIPFHLANDADVTVRIFDIRGQELRTIHLGQMPAGYYDTKGKAVLWDGRDSYGEEVSSGIYFYNLTAGKFHATRKLTIIK